MIKNDHFETQKCHFLAFLAFFKISFSSLQHPNYNNLILKQYIETDYFLCLPYAQHDVRTRGRYTKMVFNFYHTIFPGITIHRKGLVDINQLDTMYKGVLLINYDRKRKFWSPMEVRIFSFLIL